MKRCHFHCDILPVSAALAHKRQSESREMILKIVKEIPRVIDVRLAPMGLRLFGIANISGAFPETSSESEHNKRCFQPLGRIGGS